MVNDVGVTEKAHGQARDRTGGLWLIEPAQKEQLSRLEDYEMSRIHFSSNA